MFWWRYISPWIHTFTCCREPSVSTGPWSVASSDGVVVGAAVVYSDPRAIRVAFAPQPRSRTRSTAISTDCGSSSVVTNVHRCITNVVPQWMTSISMVDTFLQSKFDWSSCLSHLSLSYISVIITISGLQHAPDNVNNSKHRPLPTSFTLSQNMHNFCTIIND